MERNTAIRVAQQIMGKNFIGIDELLSVNKNMRIGLSKLDNNTVPFSRQTLEDNADNRILVYGSGLSIENTSYTLNYMRNLFGIDPTISEPCFYHQDWYINEPFASQTTLQNKWYLIEKNVQPSTRGISPDKLDQTSFPFAILTAYVFFSYFLLYNEQLWKHDYVWCSDKDSNGDMIYTGRYEDFNKVNKNGFSIHRHLRIRQFYGAVSVFES